MSRMMGELFQSSPLLIWPVISLSIFLLTFLAVLVVTLRKKPGELDPLAALPLADDENARQP
ncbi:MAG: hypothetical protein IPM79_06565 [Polyangiaceae bacterium]|nr:hypothetical protein [Polyangiaceae bacterium]MBK8937301.1 hypothetical protein [Polyangiaceae bacterium]